ncbi:MAG: transposase [Smithella sp.]|nr:transposase [Smithella sp.]
MFDIVMLDNAKAHLAGNTMTKLVDQLQCVVNFGSVATPETRGIVERFFGTLETRGFHRLPATTGSNTRDLKRRSPEKAAIAYDITFDEVVQLLDVLIAEYNTTPHSSLNNLTPLECLRQRVFESGMYPFIADDEIIKTVEKLNFITEKRRVCGGKNGKRAFINYEGAEYRSNELSVSGKYIGQTITILIDPRDISTVEAYTDNGDYIGVLKARGEYGYKRHSLKTRKNAAKLARERGRQKLEFDTPITAYELALSEKAKKSRREATRADIVRRETGKSEPSKMIEDISGDPSPIVPINSDLEHLMDITDPEEFYKKVWGAD